MTTYRDSVSLEKRISESRRIISKYPTHVPVIIECDKELSKLITKKKYLIDREVSVSYLLHTIRNKIKIDKQKAFLLFYDKVMLCPTEIIGFVYEKYKTNNKISYNDDQFFYIQVQLENTFG